MKKFFLAICLFLSSLFFLWGISNFTSAQDAETFNIKMTDWCLTWVWKWCFSLDKLLWGNSKVTRKNESRTVTTIAQDVMLSATYMVGTVLTLVIIYCGLMYIFASKDGGDVSKYKKWLIYAAVWAILVRWAYAIVRLIQYIAKW